MATAVKEQEHGAAGLAEAGGPGFHPSVFNAFFFLLSKVLLESPRAVMESKQEDNRDRWPALRHIVVLGWLKG